MQYARCRPGLISSTKASNWKKINPPLVSSQTIHSLQELRVRVIAPPHPRPRARDARSYMSLPGHIYPLLTQTTWANIKSRCWLSRSIAPPLSPPLPDIVPSGLVIHCTHNCNLAFPLLPQGRRWFRGGQAPLLLDNANDYIRANWMGPERDEHLGRQHAVLMETAPLALPPFVVVGVLYVRSVCRSAEEDVIMYRTQTCCT